MSQVTLRGSFAETRSHTGPTPSGPWGISRLPLPWKTSTSPDFLPAGGGKTAVCQCWAGDFPALDGSPAASPMRWVAATSGSEHHLIFLPTTPSHPMRGAGVTGQGTRLGALQGPRQNLPASAESSPRGIPEQEGGGTGRSRHALPPSKLQTSRRALGGRRGDVPGPDPAGRPGSASSRPRPSPAGRYSSGHG